MADVGADFKIALKPHANAICLNFEYVNPYKRIELALAISRQDEWMQQADQEEQ